ncbi:MAG TPA: 2-hydroxychromene-2-carboxylate isomerase [Gammaproteobacteria bacterium]|jgi:2-hydroxychromene-2-carboxylate isomerase|nr:2-hydroxychromene-2-carboxylate isomerase [Gammaproteobacteria bacterium]MDP6734234.1 2-hydroxychromene-2-carboxylate isomerase [Gammaproteobacteria bacterium]HAJ76830.1 2-hydroxychromene-2-carboxylate isomerase [Gammaproteobacteria bacterium]|tara:strand:- start:1251 stop:1931 length:681 start_codon:yes stop_codon:yes gene_type:complete
MKPSTLDFYFDYLSPFAFFAWRDIGKLCERNDLKLTPHPVVFGKLLDHWGQLGPAEIAPKQDWVSRYCLRYAGLHGFEYNPPKYHPFNPLPALRLSLVDVSGEQQLAVIQELFEAGWTRGEDLGDVDNLIALLEQAGIDTGGLKQKITDPDIKNALIAETSNAIAKGVFGVPTMIVTDQLFWGNDQFEHIQLLLDGNDPLHKEKLHNLKSRPRMIDRKKFIDKDKG